MSTRSSSQKKSVMKQYISILEAPRTQLPNAESFAQQLEIEFDFLCQFKNKKAYKTWLQSPSGTLEVLKDPWKMQYLRLTKWKDNF